MHRLKVKEYFGDEWFGQCTNFGKIQLYQLNIFGNEHTMNVFISLINTHKVNISNHSLRNRSYWILRQETRTEAGRS